MEIKSDYKEVYFHEYCKTCKHEKTPEGQYSYHYRNICGGSPSCGIACNHTSDIEHAVHFECIKDGTFWENEDE